MSQRRSPRPQFDTLEERAAPAGFRPIDGIGNNAAHPEWGTPGIQLVRTAPPAYADGISTPAVGSRPSARIVSNLVADQGDEDIISNRNLSAMIYAWGQFVDHDLDLTPGGGESFHIAVPTGDPSFDPLATGTKIIPLSRSVYDASTGTTTPRQQINTITAYLDGSQVYGSDTGTANKLRTHVGGQLKTSPGVDGKFSTADDELPFNNATYFPDGTLPMANDAHRVPDTQLYAAGDVRANENIELTSLHTIFVREHNRLATALQKIYPQWDDETLYQHARARVIGELEAITYNEWLPTLLGRGVGAYHGYNPSVNPGIANEFSTAIFRFGHSMLGDDVEFLDNNGVPTRNPVPLSDAFFNPTLFASAGASPILKYLASDPASELDSTVVNSVRNFLFGAPGSGGLDLASLNIQRGRDHGLADYNSIREAYDLPRVTSFAQITANSDLQARLQQLYPSVDEIDAWVGALAEDHVTGSSAGPLVQRVLLDQFTRLRDGDRFWYQNTFKGSTLYALNSTTLASVLRRNSTVTNLQRNVFFFRAQVGGTVFSDPNHNGRRDLFERPLAGITVQLIDTRDNSLLATTVTNSLGRYFFDVQDGLRTGTYEVHTVPPPGMTQTTPTRPLTFTRGDQSFRADLGLAASNSPRPPRGPLLDSSLIDTLFASQR